MLYKISKKPRFNAEKCRKKLSRNTLKNHYNWCLKEGRDVNWFDSEIKIYHKPIKIRDLCNG